MTITNEAVEVAARALMLNDPVYRKAEWDYAAKSLRSMFLSDARAALEAAEPFITAELRAEIRDRLNAMKAIEATGRSELASMLRETVALYGKPGGPWSIPSDPGGWISRARALLAKIDGEVTDHVAP
jgi:hypothetical protein